MTGFSVEVRDLDKLNRALRTVDRTFPAKVMTPALREAAEAVVLPVARSEAPVGDPADYRNRRRPAPGRLRKSVRMLVNQRSVRIAAGFARLEYAEAVHWGWARHNIAANRFLLRASADGVDRPAFTRRASRSVERRLVAQLPS